jgi:hypothetical protein
VTVHEPVKIDRELILLRREVERLTRRVDQLEREAFAKGFEERHRSLSRPWYTYKPPVRGE